MAKVIDLSDGELEQQLLNARTRALQRRIDEPYAVKGSYNSEYQRVEVELSNGFSFAFPPSLFPELSHGSPEELAEVAIDSSGYVLHWSRLDADYDLGGLVQVALGAKRWMSIRDLGRLGGQSTSPAKRAAAVAKGVKGGRPRKERRAAAFPIHVFKGKTVKAKKARKPAKKADKQSTKKNKAGSVTGRGTSGKPERRA